MCFAKLYHKEAVVFLFILKLFYIPWITLECYIVQNAAMLCNKVKGILTYGVVYEWIYDVFKKIIKLLYSVPVFNEQSSVSAQLQLAREDSSGSLLTDAEEKLSDSLTAHTESERDRKREQELLSVHMFIHSQRILFSVPTLCRLWLFPLPPTLPHSLHCDWFAGYYLLLFWTAAGTVA